MEHSIIKEKGNEVKTCGTSLKGEILATYEELVQTFGEPRKDGPEDKVTREWSVKFLNNEVATIYDWKNNDCLEGIYRWHIGGFNNSVVADVQMEYRNKMKYNNEMEQEKNMEEKTEKAIHYFYLKLENSQMLVAYRDSTANYPKSTWHWAVSLTLSEKELIDALPGSLDIEPSQKGESFGCTKLVQIRNNIEDSLVKEYEVELEFSYEVEHDFGVAGYINLYGEDGCMIEVEAKNEDDACNKAEALLLDEYEIVDVTNTSATLT